MAVVPEPVGGGGLMLFLVGCQFCKDLLSWGLAQGFAWTIGILLIVPFLCVAVITLLIVRAAKRAPR